MFRFLPFAEFCLFCCFAFRVSHFLIFAFEFRIWGIFLLNFAFLLIIFANLFRHTPCYRGKISICPQGI
ncbi:unnamed protein product [Meloidogyne enterolobii]|uniref:Uncharacterized protein n=1 Tax=Meloidogyne enterolobii TaxID=390850 RepID=A0ACB1AUI6_MELEN